MARPEFTLLIQIMACRHTNTHAHTHSLSSIPCMLNKGKRASLIKKTIHHAAIEMRTDKKIIRQMRGRVKIIVQPAGLMHCCTTDERRRSLSSSCSCFFFPSVSLPLPPHRLRPPPLPAFTPKGVASAALMRHIKSLNNGGGHDTRHRG